MSEPNNNQLSDEFIKIEQKWKPMPIEKSIQMYSEWSDKYDSVS